MLDDVELVESSVVADVARKVALLQMHSFDVLFQVELAHKLNTALSANLHRGRVVTFDVILLKSLGEKGFRAAEDSASE